MRFHSQLQHFESHFSYPISTTHRFRIIHGQGSQNGYLDFFQSLGIAKFFVALQKNNTTQQEQIVGATCAVLRKLRDNKGRVQTVWYLCDLKVIRDHQDKKVPLLLFLRIFWGALRSIKWYAISMNASIGKNKLLNYLKRQGFRFKERILNFYFFEAEEIMCHKNQIEIALNKYGFSTFSFKNNSRLKSFQLFDVNNPSNTTEWKIVHVQYGNDMHVACPIPGYIHMLATFDGSLFDKDIQALGKQPSTTATVMSRGIELPDIILTNEI